MHLTQFYKDQQLRLGIETAVGIVDVAAEAAQKTP